MHQTFKRGLSKFNAAFKRTVDRPGSSNRLIRPNSMTSGLLLWFCVRDKIKHIRYPPTYQLFLNFTNENFVCDFFSCFSRNIILSIENVAFSYDFYVNKLRVQRKTGRSLFFFEFTVWIDSTLGVIMNVWIGSDYSPCDCGENRSEIKFRSNQYLPGKNDCSPYTVLFNIFFSLEFLISFNYFSK